MQRIEFVHEDEEPAKEFGWIFNYYPRSVTVPGSIEVGMLWIEVRILNLGFLIGWTDCWIDDDEEDDEEGTNEK